MKTGVPEFEAGPHLPRESAKPLMFRRALASGASALLFACHLEPGVLLAFLSFLTMTTGLLF